MTFCVLLCSQNITGVVAAISDLLCVKIPSSYEVSSTPDRGPLAIAGGPRMGPHGAEPRPPMMFHGPGEGAGLHGRHPGAQGMMQHQQAHHFRYHPNSPGERITPEETSKNDLKPGKRHKVASVNQTCSC